MRKTLLINLLLVLVLAACGQPETGASQPTAERPTNQPTNAPTAEPTNAPALPTAEPATPATGAAPSDQLVQQARQRLAQQFGLGEKTLELHDASAQEWPNSALGCPKPDEVYMEVISPGFLLNFVSDGHTYAVHTDQQGSRMMLCENNLPTDLVGITTTDGTSTAPPAPPDATTTSPGQAPAQQPGTINNPMIGLARQSLAQDLGITADAITVVGVEAVEWNDSSLGCPKAGMNYLQVITPGYRITLEANGNRYEYHTDQGAHVVRCSVP